MYFVPMILTSHLCNVQCSLGFFTYLSSPPLHLCTPADLPSLADNQLDRQEFGAFLLRLASLMSLSLERVAISLLDDGQKFQTLGWDLVPNLFRQWDSNESGTISRHEISMALRNSDLNASFAQCMEMMNEVDSNNDSELDEKGKWCRVTTTGNVLLRWLFTFVSHM